MISIYLFIFPVANFDHFWQFRFRQRRVIMFFPKCLGVFLAVVCTVYGAPTSSSFKAVIQESVDDVQNLLAAKAAVAQFTGEAVGEAALATGSAAVDFVASIDPIEITDDLEAAVIDGKINSIKAVFDAKRALLEALAEARARHQAQVSAFFNTTVEGVGAALDTTVEGISATKEVVADIAAEITLENAKDVSQIREAKKCTFTS